MPLIVPALRLLLLFLNVYESFKTLQLPQRSARTGERTVRALTQRKRDMKGCMAIWLVWCCLTVYERLLDGIVGLFVPFYSELKALVYLFLIITRARGAEPLYLHVLRPLIKPYVSTLDWSLDLVSTLGDFLILVVTLPYNLFMEWWRPSVPEELRQDDAAGAREENPPSRRVTRSRNSSNGDTIAPAAGVRTRSSRQNLSTRTPYSGAAGPSRAIASAKQDGHTRTRSDISSRAAPMALYEVWHPPALREEGRRVVSDSAADTKPPIFDSSSTAPVSTPVKKSDQIAPSASEVEEWRLYPPFPSAYPPTPHVQSKSISGSSSSSGAANGLPPIGEDGMDISLVEVEVEEWRKYEPFPSAYPPTPQMVARTVAVTKTSSHQPILEPVEEQNQASEPEGEQAEPCPENQEAPAHKRETRSRPSRPKPTTTQSLPSRTGRRTRGKDIPRFLPSPERSRESSVEDSRSRASSGEKMEGGSQHKRQFNDDDDGTMDVDDEEDGDIDSDLDLDMTLQTPARPIIKASRRQIQTASLDTEDDTNDATEALGPQRLPRKTSSNASNLLSVPTVATRTNSNYTLSSYRNSWASSRSGSLTTLSRTSSLRTSAAVSKAPSTQSTAPSMSSRGSRSSGQASALEASDSSSVAGVKRPLSAVLGDKATRTDKQAAIRTEAKIALAREPSGGLGERVRARMSTRDTRSSGTSQKRSVDNETRSSLDEASDTLESADDGNTKLAIATGATKKRRRMGPVVSRATSLLDRATSLEQVPEEAAALGRSTKRSRIRGDK